MSAHKTSSVHHAREGASILVSRLLVPEDYVDTKSRVVDDHLLRNSIELGGIQQPLIVLRVSENKYSVVDGVRRLKIARDLGLREVPCVIEAAAEDDEDPVSYRNRMRFILDEHRQDLLPTQRASLIAKLREMYRMTGKDVAAYLGVTPGTITNWSIIQKLNPEIQRAIDGGEISVHCSRAFAGLSRDGQQKIWEEHADEIRGRSASQLHRFVREKYPPEKHPSMYESAQRSQRMLRRDSVKRQSKKRPRINVDRKDLLLRDVDAKKSDLEDKQMRIARLQTDIEEASKVVPRLRRAKAAWDSLPVEIRADLENFMERLGLE